ncbi:MAG: response regulator [candidate division Zixibacteria bacterium]|nr:response regulator [candidate division Zixibacteria bacterium]
MPEKILVADDSPTVRNVADSLLRKHGYEVLLADDGVKALSMARTDKPDLIFLDSSLSALDREQVYSQIKHSGCLEGVPVVMILSQDEKEREFDLKQISAKAFITKPFDPREILDHVERLLNKDRSSKAGEEQKASQPLPPERHVGAHEEKTSGTVSEREEIKSEDDLSFVETSDLVGDFDPSAPESDEEAAHGFEWFLHELKKETHDGEKADSRVKAKAVSSEGKIADGKGESIGESQAHKIDQHEERFEDFVKNLKMDLGEVEKEQTSQVQPPPTGAVSSSQSDQSFSDLKEKICERIAREVARNLSPEFLEKIIREEVGKITRDSS